MHLMNKRGLKRGAKPSARRIGVDQYAFRRSKNLEVDLGGSSSASIATVVSLLEGYNQLSSSNESVLQERGDETIVSKEVTNVTGGSAVVVAERTCAGP
ncbi:hypothetical protein QVD17_30311 [Tagetes erecta]|uniref:Uncharacterized protein n=1 Tax=Tagetes erecta TaxID=13708 RepID=A0AAD8K7Q8_TARER|nr:hypothetical protein QVD17_30311 [Tagetes erecta]